MGQGQLLENVGLLDLEVVTQRESLVLLEFNEVDLAHLQALHGFNEILSVEVIQPQLGQILEAALGIIDGDLNFGCAIFDVLSDWEVVLIEVRFVFSVLANQGKYLLEHFLMIHVDQLCELHRLFIVRIYRVLVLITTVTDITEFPTCHKAEHRL